MKKLKIVNDWNKEGQKFIPEEWGARSINSWWYLHGDLESLSSPDNPYDKGVIINLDEFPEYCKQTLLWYEMRNHVSHQDDLFFYNDVYINGIVDVEVFGVDEPCVGFFWTGSEHTCVNIDSQGNKTEFDYWEQRGLICLKSDRQACDEALNLYNKRSSCL